MNPITFEVPNLQVSYNGNGTAWMVKDVKPGSYSSHHKDVTAVGNMFFFLHSSAIIMATGNYGKAMELPQARCWSRISTAEVIAVLLRT